MTDDHLSFSFPPSSFLPLSPSCSSSSHAGSRAWVFSTLTTRTACPLILTHLDTDGGSFSIEEHFSGHGPIETSDARPSFPFLLPCLSSALVDWSRVLYGTGSRVSQYPGNRKVFSQIPTTKATQARTVRTYQFSQTWPEPSDLGEEATVDQSCQSASQPSRARACRSRVVRRRSRGASELQLISPSGYGTVSLSAAIGG